jgi:hypothetical protein
MPFNSFEDVDRWVAEHSRAQFEESFAGRRFTGQDLIWAQSWRERELRRERDARTTHREAVADKGQALEAAIGERVATATESQAKSAEEAVRIAKWALWISIAALVMALGDFLLKWR